MSLRSKLVALFAALAVVPLLAVGIFDYLRSIRALESLIIAQTSLIAERAARELGERYRVLEANTALLADNAETNTLYQLNSRATRPSASRDSVEQYLATVYQAVAREIAWVSYHAVDGSEIYRLGEDDRASEASAPVLASTYVVERRVRDAQGKDVGTVYVAARIDSLLPRAALDAHFGRSGFSAVVETRRDSLVYVSGATEAAARALIRQWFRKSMNRGDDAQAGTMLVPDGDSARIVSRAVAAGAPFAVFAAATVDEFAAPFAQIRTSNLAVVLALTVAVAFAFLFFLWRGTASLSALTVAADDVAAGNLEPSLPRAGRDEVGRLSAAFAYMLERIRATLREVERSRQLAAVGEFASQIAHEIRNPLTGIKLNLQKLERAKSQGRIPEDLTRPVEISLAEIHRLDGVVRGVLQLGRPGSATRTEFSVQDVLTRALETARGQFEPSGVVIVAELTAEQDRVSGDPGLLQAGIANVLLNGAEAMPQGGALYVMTENDGDTRCPVIRIRIEDDGPGVAAAARDRIFDPFFTTKQQGTGLGLALVHRTVEEHGGRLSVESPVRGSGAAFVMELPLANGVRP